MKTIFSNRNILSGLFFIAVSIVFGGAALSLRMGTFGRMGPGYMPVALAILLGLLGLVIVIRALILERGLANRVAGVPAPRGLILIPAAALAFAFCVRPLGFIPATIVATLLAIAAGAQSSLLGTVVLTTVLTVGAWAVFILGLELHWPLLGTLFR